MIKPDFEEVPERYFVDGRWVNKKVGLDSTHFSGAAAARGRSQADQVCLSLTGKNWAEVPSSCGCCPGLGAFSGGRRGPKVSTIWPHLLKGGRNLACGRGDPLTLGTSAVDPREGNRALETESRDPKRLERRWGRENWTGSCQMTPRPGE